VPTFASKSVEEAEGKVIIESICVSKKLF
jgi:hypothetical protein